MTQSVRHKAKKIVRAGFRQLGYDVQRLPRSWPASAKLVVFQEGTRGHRIEFVGASGVGKTTLFSELIRVRDDDDRWIPVSELLDQRELSRMRGDQVDDAYEKLFDLKISSVYDWDLGSLDKGLVLGWCHRLVMIDATINSVETDSHVILDEGLLQQFGDAVMDLHGQCADSVDRLLANRAVVHCWATPQIITERIFSTQRQGSTWVLHQGLTRDELLECSTRSLARKAALVRFLRERGVAYLDVETNDDLETNVQRVRSFVGSLGLT